VGEYIIIASYHGGSLGVGRGTWRWADLGTLSMWLHSSTCSEKAGWGDSGLAGPVAGFEERAITSRLHIEHPSIPTILPDMVRQVSE
jgi:hypothetical protein